MAVSPICGAEATSHIHIDVPSMACLCHTVESVLLLAGAVVKEVCLSCLFTVIGICGGAGDGARALPVLGKCSGVWHNLLKLSF